MRLDDLDPTSNANDQGSGGGGFGGGPTGIGNEDNEVEVGAVASQNLDLEAFDLNGSSLSLWGGFNFVNGEDQSDSLWGSGDTFIDLNGDAQLGCGYGSERLQFVL